MLTSAVSRNISESDWKLFRQLRPLALERFCQHVLGDIGRIAQDTGRTTHERYRAIYDLVRHKDRVLADLFDDPRRSTALLQLRAIHSHGLLTEDEFARFSTKIRESVTWHDRI